METAETLTLHQLIGVLRRRSWIVLQLAIICAAVGVGLGLRESKQYDASASVLVGAREMLPIAGLSNSSQSLTAPTAAKLLQTRSIAARVKRALHTDLSTGELLSRITTTVNAQDGILSVNARGSSGSEAASIANAFATQFVAARAEAPYVRLTRAIAAVERAIKTVPPRGAQREALSTQLAQLQALQALPTTDAQLVDPAVAPNDSSGPHLIRNGLLGLGLGVLLGVLLAFLIEALDPRVKASEEVQRIVPAPQLASVPAAIFRRSIWPNRRREPRVLAAARNQFEAFERLRTSLLVFNGERELKSVLVTSARDHREGKTTVAANLAVSLSKMGLRVCVVDADLRSPRLSRHFGFGDDERGLTDVLNGSPLKSVIRSFAVPGAPSGNGNGNGHGNGKNGGGAGQGGIAVLCAGTFRSNPAEALAGKPMQDTLDELEARYDMVILDSAPLLSASDAMPLLPRTDGTLLVVRLFHTPRKAAVRAVRVIERARGGLLGVVSTGVPERELREEGFGPWPVESSQRPSPASVN